MGTRPHATIVTMCTGLLLVGPSAGATSGPGPQERLAHWREAAFRVSSGTDLARLVAGAEDPFAAARRATIGSMLELAGLPGLDQSEFQLRDSFLSAAGDLDADGREDAVEVTAVFDFVSETVSTTVSALRGSTGQAFWTRNVDGFAVAVAAGNLDTQAGDDLYIVEERTEELGTAMRSQMTIAGVRGNSSATLWTRSNESVSNALSGGPLAAGTDVEVPVLLDLTDANGDGAQDLLLGRYDAALVEEDTSQTVQAVVAAAFEFVSGRTGGAVSMFAASGRNAVPDAVVVPDLSGDGLADLAVLSLTRAGAGGAVEGTIDAFSGGGGAPRWRASVQEPAPPSLHGLRLNGDGTGDVLVQTTSGGSSGNSTELQALSGANGASMWTTTFDAPVFVREAGDATGDGGQDILAFPAFFDGGPSTTGLRLVRGSDGTTVWQHLATFVSVAGDATGDGVLDAVSIEFTGDGFDSTLISGANGSDVWSRKDKGFGLVIAAFADLDGEGSDDLVSLVFDSSSDSYVAVDGATGKDLWKDPVDVGGFLFRLAAASVRSGAGADLLESVAGDPDDFTAARSGADGSILWLRLPA